MGPRSSDEVLLERFCSRDFLERCSTKSCETFLQRECDVFYAAGKEVGICGKDLGICGSAKK